MQIMVSSLFLILFATCVSSIPLDDGWGEQPSPPVPNGWNKQLASPVPDGWREQPSPPVLSGWSEQLPSPVPNGWGEQPSGRALTAAAKLHGYSGNYGLGGALGGLTLQDMAYDLTDSFTTAAQSVGIRLGLPTPKDIQVPELYAREQYVPSPELSLPPPPQPQVPSEFLDHTLIPGSAPLITKSGPVVPALTHLIPNFEVKEPDFRPLSPPLPPKPSFFKKDDYGLPPSSLAPLSEFKSMADVDISEVLHSEDSRLEGLRKSAHLVAGPELAPPTLQLEHKKPLYHSVPLTKSYKYMPLTLGDRVSSKLISPDSSDLFANFKHNFQAVSGPKVSGYTSHVIHEPKHGKGYGQSSVSFTMVHGVPQKAPQYYQKYETPITPLDLNSGFESDIIKKYDQDLSGGYGSLLTGSFGSILTNEYKGFGNGLEFLFKKKK